MTRSSWSHRRTWLAVVSASIVFALSVPATQVLGRLGHVFLLGHLVAVGVPAFRLGRRGAWAGALLSLVGFMAADVADGLVRGSLAGLLGDLVFIGIGSAVLAVMFGEAGRLAFRYRTLAARSGASERWFNELFNGLPSGLLVMTGDGRIELANRRAGELLGRPSRALVGYGLGQLVAPTDWPRLVTLLAAPQPTGGLPLRVRLAETGLRTDWVCSPHMTPSGPRVIAHLWDAEQLIQHEKDLSTWAAAIQCLQEGVMLADLTGRIQFANPAAARIYGFDHPEEVVGTSLADHLAPASLDGFPERLRRAQRLGWSGEIGLRRPDGTDVPVRVTTSPVRVERELIGTVGVISDLSEQRAMADRATAADKLATLGRLVAGAAHEINNPLAAIQSNAELLLVSGGASPAVAQEGLQVIVDESRRAGRIVRDLLSFARQQPVARTTVNLHSLVCDALALRASYMRASGVRVTLSGEDLLVFVQADSDQLKQVLLNLIGNAEHAVSDRHVRELRVTVSRVGEVAMVCVDDSGVGVPEQLRDRVFEPFFTTKPQGEGTGLGLSVSYGIIHEHGGRIWVETGPLGGARFVVQLPIATEECPGARRLPRVSNPAPGVTGRRVLVVDDERAIREASRKILTRFGHEVVTAEDGNEALAAVRQHAFDIIISDLRMPEKSGQELYMELQREGLLRDTRFVVSTGDIADIRASEFVRSQGLPVLLKPFELVALLEVVDGSAEAQAA